MNPSNQLPTDVQGVPGFAAMYKLPNTLFPSFVLLDSYLRNRQGLSQDRFVSERDVRASANFYMHGGVDPFKNPLPYTVAHKSVSTGGIEQEVRVKPTIEFGQSTVYTPKSDAEFLTMYYDFRNQDNPFYEGNSSLLETHADLLSYALFDPGRSMQKELDAVAVRAKAMSLVQGMIEAKQNQDLQNLAIVLNVDYTEAQARNLQLLNLADKNPQRILSKLPDNNPFYDIELLLGVAVANEVVKFQDNSYWYGTYPMGSNPQAVAASFVEFPTYLEGIVRGLGARGKQFQKLMKASKPS